MHKKEDWMNSKWRPMMGWMYMLVCTFDFVVAPILWSLVQAIYHGVVTVQWQPLTLQGAGLFHISMGAVIGVSAYGRTQEKLNGANNGNIPLPTNVATAYTANTPVGAVGQGLSPTASGFNPTSTTGFSAPTPTSGGGGGYVLQGTGASSGFSGSLGGAPAPIATTASGKKIVPDDPNGFPLQ